VRCTGGQAATAACTFFPTGGRGLRVEVRGAADENKMLVRRQFDEIWNGGNWTGIDELSVPN
jgi:hypothetical protein